MRLFLVLELKIGKNISERSNGMASENKKKKLKNSYCYKSALKNKLPNKCKRLLFFTSSQRKENNSFNVEE